MEMHAYEGFCEDLAREDLARQNTVAHLSQLQLGSALSYMGFYIVAYRFQSSS
jgi:hypothetical protein